MGDNGSLIANHLCMIGCALERHEARNRCRRRQRHTSEHLEGDTGEQDWHPFTPLLIHQRWISSLDVATCAQKKRWTQHFYHAQKNVFSRSICFSVVLTSREGDDADAKHRTRLQLRRNCRNVSAGAMDFTGNLTTRFGGRPGVVTARLTCCGPSPG